MFLFKKHLFKGRDILGYYPLLQCYIIFFVKVAVDFQCIFVQKTSS